MARSSKIENLLSLSWGQLSTTCSDLLKQPNWQFLVAVDHSQLRTMASETEDSIDWRVPPKYLSLYTLDAQTLYRAVPPKRHLHGLNTRYKAKVHST